MIIALAALLAAGQPAVSSPMPAQSSPVQHQSSRAAGAPGGQAMRMPSPAERAKLWNEQFDIADTNHDGSLSRREFAAAAEKALAMKMQLLQRMMQMQRARPGAGAGTSAGPR